MKRLHSALSYVLAALAVAFLAVAASAETIPGGKQLLAARVYNVTEMTPGVVNWQGVPGTIIRGVDVTHGDGAKWLIHLTAAGSRFDGIRFEGGTHHIDGDGSKGLIVNNCEFDLGANLHPTGGLSGNSQITNNLFNGSPWTGFGLSGENLSDTTIANNLFTNIGAGIHFGIHGASKNLLIEQNTFAGIKNGMGVELVDSQDPSMVNCIEQDNYYDPPNQTTNDSTKLTNFMAFSMAMSRGHGNIYRRNTIHTLTRPDGVGVRIGFETMGGTVTRDAAGKLIPLDPVICSDNYVYGDGMNHVIVNNDGAGESAVIISGNRISGYLQGPSASFPASNRLTLISNNGPNTVLTWDTNRPRPGRNRRIGAPPVVIPPPTTQPIPNPIPAKYEGTIQFDSATGSVTGKLNVKP